MVVKYQAAGLYWITVYLLSNFEPQVNVDFLAINSEQKSAAVYYVTHNQTLYILFETPNVSLEMYFRDNVTNQVLTHDGMNMTFVGQFPQTLAAYKKAEIQPTKDIKSVLLNLPDGFVFSYDVTTIFLRKYPYIIKEVTFPPLTNG
nr:hypothetical protein [Abalone asfa-like virus]